MRLHHALVATALALACGGPPTDDDDTIEIPLPPGAARVNLDAAPGNEASLKPGIYPLSSVRRVRAFHDGTSRYVVLDAAHWVTELFCNDFGCTTWWRTKLDTFCLKVDAAGAALSTEAGCEQAAALQLDVDPPDPAGLHPHLAAAAGFARAAFAELKGFELSRSEDGSRVEWIGGAKTSAALSGAFGDWLDSDSAQEQEWAVRASFVDGVLAGPPVVEPAPGGRKFLDSLTVSRDAAGARAVLLKTRESGLLAVSNDPGPLTTRYVGEGYHLPPDTEWSRGETAGAFLDGDQLVELFLAPAKDPLGNIDPGALGGEGIRPSDLYVRVRPALAGSAATFHPFTLLHARSSAADSAIACLDRPYDPASLASATATVSPTGTVRSVSATSVPACVAVQFESVPGDRGHVLSLSGLTDLEGAPLGTTQASFLSTPARTRDLALELASFGAGGQVPANCGSVSCAGSIVAGMWPLADGRVLAEVRGGEVLPAGFIVWGLDLFSWTRVHPGFGGTVEQRLFDREHGRLWLLVRDGAVRRVVYYDGAAWGDWEAGDHALLTSIDSLQLLGDGSAVTGPSSAPVRIAPDGTVSAFPAAFGFGTVLGSADYLAHAQGVVTRRTPDGTVTRTFRIGDDWSHASAMASEGGRDYACTSTGLYTFDGETPRKLEWTGRQSFDCARMERGPGGALWVWLSTGAYVPEVVVISNGTVTRRVVRDPMYPSSSERFVFAPIQRGPRLFFWATGDFLNTSNAPATLRLTDLATFDALPSEAP